MTRRKTLAVAAAMLIAGGAAAQTASYTGRPYNGPHAVTRSGATVEAEDFDDDEYRFANTTDGNARSSYRTDRGVALSTSKTHNGGDWLKYTFTCTKAGTYDVNAYLATDYNGSGGSFSLVFDEGTAGEQRSGTIRFRTPGG